MTRAIEPRRCSKCGYILDNNESVQCPECGLASIPFTPIASYREHLGLWRFTYYLGQTQILIQGHKLFGEEIETIFDLNQLDPDPRYRRARSKLLGTGLSMLLVGGAFALFWWIAPSLDEIWIMKWGATGIATLGLILAAVGWRKTEHLHFHSTHNDVRFTISRAGPDTSYFDEFVNQLRAQIRAIRRLS